MIAGIELGGTKVVVATGSADGRVLEEQKFPTTTPEETLDRVIAWLRARGSPRQIGIAAFGPVAINPNHARYGKILDTPKAGWSGFDLLGSLAAAFPAASFAIDTDVNAAVLAEAKFGAAAGLQDVVYITIGTGIGAGVLTDGRLLHGALHPEFGHLKVPRMEGDFFIGVCPYHQDCLEGLASGPAIAARWGKLASELPSDHPAWELEAWYIAHGILSLVAIVSPARVIIGGGVSQTSGLHDKIHGKLIELAAGYYTSVIAPDFIAAPLLGQDAGIRGAFQLTISHMEF